MPSRLVLGASAAIVAAVLVGCGGAPAQLPESAGLAPGNAVVFARVTTDSGSSQWKAAESVLARIPGFRDGLVSAIRGELASQSLEWEEDVAPALGEEVVLVVTASMRPVVLLRPESGDKLAALLAKSDDDFVRGEVEDHVALAERESDLTEYREALERGTIAADEAFVAGLQALPDESLGLVWMDMEALTKELSPLLEERAQGDLDLGIEWLAAALSAEDEGMLMAIGARAPGAGDTHYEPELFRSVPADAVAAFSFGGTQGTLDRIQGRVDVDGLSKSFEELTGVSLDGVLDALSGEGVLYVRPGETVPDVTLALAPPDPAKTWSTVDRLARELASEAQVEVTTAVERGVEVSLLEVEGVTIRYARLDAGTIVVSTGADALTLSTDAGGPKLVDSEGYRRAAAGLGLEDRTKGFLYVDVDGMLPLLDDLAGGAIPEEVRDGFRAVDSILFQASGEGDSTLVSGLVRVP